MTESVRPGFPVLPLRDRIVILSALSMLTVWAWFWLLNMPPMDGASMGAEAMMPRLQSWTQEHVFGMFLMWAIMMVGMMVPSASPMVLLYARVSGRGFDPRLAYLRTVLFTAGYIAVWTAFSALATAAQWALEELAFLSSMMKTVSPIVGGIILIAAGIYQLTPAKRACLEHCRTPFAFVMHHWRLGSPGAFLMGLEHGAYCLGCCWALMVLLFVVGVMNLLWVAIIAAFVLAEKILPIAQFLAKASAVALMLAGAYMAFAGQNLF